MYVLCLFSIFILIFVLYLFTLMLVCFLSVFLYSFFFFFIFFFCYCVFYFFFFFFFSSRRRHTRYIGDWSSDVCSSDLTSPRKSVTSWRPGPLCRENPCRSTCARSWSGWPPARRLRGGWSKSARDRKSVV